MRRLPLNWVEARREESMPGRAAPFAAPRLIFHGETSLRGARDPEAPLVGREIATRQERGEQEFEPRERDSSERAPGLRQRRVTAGGGLAVPGRRSLCVAHAAVWRPLPQPAPPAGRPV